MTTNEDDLQKEIESGGYVSGDELDVKAYQEVFARLKKTPEAKLSVDFADKIIVRIIEKQQKTSSRDLYWLALGVSLLAIAVVVATVMTGFKPTLGFLKGISAYTGVFAFGVAFILFLNRLDKKFLSKSE